MTTFNLLHGKVQSFIYSQKWTEFRPIQDEAIVAISNGNKNVLISAPTASGKTEAAFLPIVSKIADDYSESFRAVYISPLKALINDQFRRVDAICKAIGVPVTRWHGDVGQTSKRNSIENPSGILLITPESLEAMLINKPTLLRKAFEKLEYFVIDEIHSFVGTERGFQLLSIMNRISIEARCKPMKIALSATIGNPQDVAKWLDPSTECQIIADDDWNEDSGIEGIIRGFTSKIDTESKGDPSLLNPSLIESLYLNFLEGKNLIFGNSKKKLEETAYSVANIARNRNRENQFQIHHGSLSKFIRETTENELKNDAKPISVFCTSTLEMGIDIGTIEKIGLIDPPWSVSGFAQRIGRSGRKSGGTKKFEFLINHYEQSGHLNLSESLREDLVKSISIVLLYLKGFKEPLDTKSDHPSTLIHQILSHCVQYEGASYDSIRPIVEFYHRSNNLDLPNLLHHLCENKILYKDSSNRFMAGKEGEKISSTFEFYSVFLSSEQWTVVHDGQLIGQIPVIGVYREQDNLLLGGRVWTVIVASEHNRKLIVKPATNANAPIFTASFGMTHEAIHKMMLEVYRSDIEYPFLDSEALRLLSEARQNFIDIFQSPASRHILLPIFEGTKVQNTVSTLLNLCGVDFGMSEVCLEISSKNLDWKAKIEKELDSLSTEMDLAKQIPRENKILQKYDKYLPAILLEETYSRAQLDLTNTKLWLRGLG